MSTTPRIVPFLKASAAILFAGGILLWLATGAHRGWTQTSVTEQKRDEITGIDYPVRHSKFIAGVEIPALTTCLAGALFSASFFFKRNPAKQT